MRSSCAQANEVLSRTESTPARMRDHLPNPEFEEWSLNDDLVLDWIKATVSNQYQLMFLKCKSAFERWYSLVKIKGLVESLASTGEVISHDQQIYFILVGLGSEYHMLLTTTRSRSSTTFEELTDLTSEENLMKRLNSENQVSVFAANYSKGANNYNSVRSKGQGGYNNQGSYGSGSYNYPPPQQYNNGAYNSGPFNSYPGAFNYPQPQVYSNSPRHFSQPQYYRFSPPNPAYYQPQSPRG